MKKLLILLIFCSGVCFSQDFIQKKDGSKIIVADGSIRNEPRNKRVGYLLKDDQKEYHIRYKELDQASYSGMLLKSFIVKNKVRAFFVLTESDGKILASSKQTRIKSRGGFESTFIYYDLVVLDKVSNLLESLSFTDQKTDKSIETRRKIIPLIKQYFPECIELMEKVALFESPQSDTQSNTILVLLNDPVYIKCKN